LARNSEAGLTAGGELVDHIGKTAKWRGTEAAICRAGNTT